MTNLLRIRSATGADSKNLWEWRNDPLTRKTSIHHKKISWEEHERWYKEVLENKNCKIFIGEDIETNSAIGMVRFDIEEGQFSANISINLKPDYRGKGLSKPFLSQAIEEFKHENALVLIAKIIPDNIPSIICFEHCDFVLDSSSPELLIYKNKQGIIDAIEQVRSANNVNWMDLLRLAFRKAPKEAEEIVSRINSDDGRISELLKRLGS